MKEFQNEIFEQEYTYRGVTVQIWNDDYGQQRFLRFINDPLFGTQDIGLGSYNIHYKEDINYLIDEKLDLIFRFNDPYFGAKLMWFQNGAFRDIKLTYKNRILKVFLVVNGAKVNLEKLTAEALKILENFHKIVC